MMTQSPSSLKTFINCPALYKARYIDKIIKFTGNAATERGELIHKRMEELCLGSALSPDWGTNGDGAKLYGQNFINEVLKIGSLREKGVKIYVERQIAINAKGEIVDWWDKSAILRSRIDLFIDMEYAGAVIDWKTGRTPGDPLQLLINAMCLYPLNPKTRYDGYFVYLDQAKVDSSTMIFDTAPLNSENGKVLELRLWLEKLERAYAENTFPATANNDCRWCDLRSNCDSRS
ncbi:MAG: PD-(D/E)XK nuclease family protein [Deltaproteobacteria bacterium]|jgi:hypothetical protein|nr:PD-(D/E)XK nuclease family protein [Deltaproteobacteria bacterium]